MNHSPSFCYIKSVTDLPKFFVSLEYAKKLKELNMPQKSMWYHVVHPTGTHSLHFGNPLLEPDVWDKDSEFYSAYLSDELIEFMPRCVEQNNKTYCLVIYRVPSAHWPMNFMVEYLNTENHIHLLGFEAGSTKGYLPNALAKALVHLIKNNLLTP